MNINKIKIYIIFHLALFSNIHAICQHATNTESDTTIIEQKHKKFYHTGLFKATIVPAALIGYGISTIHGNGLYSSFDAYRDIHKTFNFNRTHVDDFLQYAPYAELLLLNLFKVKCKNDLINTAILVGKSQLLMAAIVFPIKSITNITRPDSVGPSKNNSFPSGHTANAFVAASIVHKEFKHKSVWYGVGAYTIAASVGVFRMLNNRHWQADVFTGAGIGMLSVHLAYLTHKYRWGKKCEALLIPTYNQKTAGIFLQAKF